MGSRFWTCGEGIDGFGNICQNGTMAKHVSETPATQLLRTHNVAYTEHPYAYLEHGGAQHSAQVLGCDPFVVVKTLIMQDHNAKPLIVLMHGNRKVSTPFGTRRTMPVYMEESILTLPNILINGGRRGYLLGISPIVCVQLLGAKAVQCALAD